MAGEDAGSPGPGLLRNSWVGRGSPHNEVHAVTRVSALRPLDTQEPPAVWGLRRLRRHDSRGQPGTARDSRGQPWKATCPDGEGLPTTLTTMVSIHPSQARVCLCEGATRWEASIGGSVPTEGLLLPLPWASGHDAPGLIVSSGVKLLPDTGTWRGWSRGHQERGWDQFSQHGDGA